MWYQNMGLVTKKKQLRLAEFSVIWKSSELDEKFDCRNKKILVRDFCLANCSQFSQLSFNAAECSHEYFQLQ